VRVVRFVGDPRACERPNWFNPAPGESTLQAVKHSSHSRNGRDEGRFRPHFHQTVNCCSTFSPQAQRHFQELARAAFFNPKRLYYLAGHAQAGRLIPISELDDDVSACLAAHEMVRANLNPADGKRDVKWLHKFKYYDKVRALEMLAKHFALLKDSVDLQVTTDWEKLAARLASVRTEPIDPRQFLAPAPERDKGVSGATLKSINTAT
jgi:hypothetical protein